MSRIIRMKHFADGHTEEIIEERPDVQGPERLAAQERLWALVTQWRAAAVSCRTPPVREEIALLWDRVANELRAALPDSGTRPARHRRKRYDGRVHASR